MESSEVEVRGPGIVVKGEGEDYRSPETAGEDSGGE